MFLCGLTQVVKRRSVLSTQKFTVAESGNVVKPNDSNASFAQLVNGRA